jgi:hypothetical protein
MAAGQLSLSAVVCVFGEQAVQDDRQANGRFIPPTSRAKAAMVAGMLDVARRTGGPAAMKADARLEKVMATGMDRSGWQLPTLLMSLTAWSLREQGLADLAPMASTAPEPVSSAFPTRVFGTEHAPTRTCRMTLRAWAPRPSVEGLLLDTLRAGKPTGIAARWREFGGSLGTEGSLRWTIAITEFGRPDDPWKGIQRLWEREAIGAGLLTMKGLPGFRRPKQAPGAVGHLTPAYTDAMARWCAFNRREPELAQAIRQDAFLGINSHMPNKPDSSYS